MEPSPPPMASDSPFEARRRTRPRSRNISASEGASLSTPGPRTSTRSTGRRSSRLRFVTRPMSSTRSSITRPIFRSSSTRRTPLATPGSSSPRASGDLGAQRLYRLDAPPWKEGVAVLLKGLVRSKTLLDNWDELLRVAGLTQVGLGDRIAPDFEAPDWRKRERLVPSPPRTAPLPILRSRREGTAPSSRSADESGPLPKLGHECHRHLEHRLHERRHRTAADSRNRVQVLPERPSRD